MKEVSIFKIKSGEEICIREATLADAEELMAMKIEYLDGTRSIPLYVHEYPTDVDFELDLIRRLATEKNSVLLVAEKDGRLIGNIDLNGNQRKKLFHTGVVGMGLRESWRGKGVGTALMKALLDWSIANPNLTLLWLEVYENNVGGRKLYEKSGFIECGRISNFFNEGDLHIDKLTMVKHL